MKNALDLLVVLDLRFGHDFSLDKETALSVLGHAKDSHEGPELEADDLAGRDAEEVLVVDQLDVALLDENKLPDADRMGKRALRDRDAVDVGQLKKGRLDHSEGFGGMLEEVRADAVLQKAKLDDVVVASSRDRN